MPRPLRPHKPFAPTLRNGSDVKAAFTSKPKPPVTGWVRQRNPTPTKETLPRTPIYPEAPTSLWERRRDLSPPPERRPRSLTIQRRQPRRDNASRSRSRSRDPSKFTNKLLDSFDEVRDLLAAPSPEDAELIRTYYANWRGARGERKAQEGSDRRDESRHRQRRRNGSTSSSQRARAPSPGGPSPTFFTESAGLTGLYANASPSHSRYPSSGSNSAPFATPLRSQFTRFDQGRAPTSRPHTGESTASSTNTPKGARGFLSRWKAEVDAYAEEKRQQEREKFKKNISRPVDTGETAVHFDRTYRPDLPPAVSSHENPSTGVPQLSPYQRFHNRGKEPDKSEPDKSKPPKIQLSHAIDRGTIFGDFLKTPEAPSSAKLKPKPKLVSPFHRSNAVRKQPKRRDSDESFFCRGMPESPGSPDRLTSWNPPRAATPGPAATATVHSGTSGHRQDREEGNIVIGTVRAGTGRPTVESYQALVGRPNFYDDIAEVGEISHVDDDDDDTSNLYRNRAMRSWDELRGYEVERTSTVSPILAGRAQRSRYESQFVPARAHWNANQGRGDENNGTGASVDASGRDAEFYRFYDSLLHDSDTEGRSFQKRR